MVAAGSWLNSIADILEACVSQPQGQERSTSEQLSSKSRIADELWGRQHFRRVRAERELQVADASEEERQNVLKALQQQERDFLRLQRQRLSAADFEPLTIIGRGAFGEVNM